MDFLLEQFEQLVHSYEQVLVENVRLSCEACRLRTENNLLRMRLEGLVDADVLARDQERFCALEGDVPPSGGGTVVGPTEQPTVAGE